MTASANELTACEIVEQITNGTLRAEDVAEAVIARHEERDREIQAFSHFDPAHVRAQARRLDAQEDKGPLHGVAVGVKDVINTKDMPTAHNTARYANHRPAVDAACVDLLRAAGVLFVGKTVTPEFAASPVPGPTRNPHDLSRTPGGSSSGSAAAVADYQCTIAVGAQTGGSIVRPASFNGVYGWKPTWSGISVEGLKPYSATCDTIGLFARSANDLALLADVFDFDELESGAVSGLDGARVGVCRSHAWSKALPATRRAIADVSASMRAAGAAVVDVTLPREFDASAETHAIIVGEEGHSAFLNEYRNTAGLSEKVTVLAQRGDGYSLAKRRAAYRLADQCRAMFDDIAAEHDVIVTPSATGEAPIGLEFMGDWSFNSMWTLLQVPVINVPGHSGPAGMPVGISLVGRRYEDRKLINFAALVGAAWAHALSA